MDKRKKNHEGAIEMYLSGLSAQDVAAHFGVTRQAMWEWLRSRSVEMRPKCLPSESRKKTAKFFRPQKRFGSENNFYRGGPKADDRAQNTLEKAVKKGIVQKKTHCEKCGFTGTFKDGRSAIQAHHCDYNKPLDVMWLCQKCHHEWHKHNQPIERRC